jgi:hypothetical protein
MHPDDTHPLVIAVHNGDIFRMLEILGSIDTDEIHLNKFGMVDTPYSLLLSKLCHALNCTTRDPNMRILSLNFYQMG